MAHTHRFRIAYNLALGVPWADGWYPVLVIRACRECDYAEVFFGQQSPTLGRNRLYAWEAWVDGRLYSQGDHLKWKAH